MKQLISVFVTLMATGLSFASPPQQAEEFTLPGLFTLGIEGPASDKQGRLYAVNFDHEGSIGVIDKQGKASHFIDLPLGSTGNGLRFDQQGYMYVADYTGHNILRIDPNNKSTEVYIHEPRMHQPNDIAITASGVLYASDPDWQNNSGQLWLIKPDRSVSLLETDMGTTNGIEVSPDEKYLYVNESAQRRVWKYDILADYRLANKRLFHQFDDFGLDGMRSDIAGNLYIARYGAGVVAILSEQGHLLDEIQLSGQFPTNVAFGGEQGNEVFVTLQKRGSIDRFIGRSIGRSVQILRHDK